MSKPRVLRGDRCKCSACDAHFNSTRAFDRHRSGAFGIDRRCLTFAEMLGRGMAVNAAGFWITSPRKASAPKREEPVCEPV